MTLSEELELYVESAQSIPASKRYWLIRTQGGSLWETFKEFSFVALEHDQVPLSMIDAFEKEFKDDSIKIQSAIRKRVTDVYRLRTQELVEAPAITPRRAGLIASQIYKFVYEVKPGDSVIIPSTNSDIISFGTIIKDTPSDAPIRARQVPLGTILTHRVKWIKDVARLDLDPYLYRMFTAHQALVDVDGYADVIERSVKDFFILDEEAHLIVNVQNQNEIPAADLFGLGSELLYLIDEFSRQYELGVSASDLQVTVNLNSPGKIDFKSKIKKTTFVAGLILAVFGGGYKTPSGTELATHGIPGLIEAISKFREDEQQRAMRQQIFEKYKDSLQVKSPDDMVKLLKQFSENKDKAK